MTTYLVTRHPATRLWANAMAKHGRLPFAIDHSVEHLDLDRLTKGDVVVGNLPVHLVAELHHRGIAFWSLDLDVPPADRGKELTALQMMQLGARLTRYEVRLKESQEVAATRARRRAAAGSRPSITLIPVSEQLVPAAIGWLHHRTEHVVLLTSPAMEGQAACLKRWLAARQDRPKKIVVRSWEDATYSTLTESIEALASELGDTYPSEVVINLTGGTKPMAMALQRAFGKRRHDFDGALSGPYVDTFHRRIDDLLAEHNVSRPMHGVLNIQDMLTLQGLDVVSAHSAIPGFDAWLSRKSLFQSLLSTGASNWIGVWYSALGLANSLVNPRVNNSGRRSTSNHHFTVEWNGNRVNPTFKVVCTQPRQCNWNGLERALKSGFGKGLVQHSVCTLELNELEMMLEFQRDPLDEVAFASGGWMEAWLVAQFAASGVDEWAQGVTIRNAGVKNEFDLIALSGNRTLVVEVKTANLSRDGVEDSKATEAVYKLDALAQKLGRYFNERWLVSLRPLNPHDIGRAQRHGIRVFQGGVPAEGAQSINDLKAAIADWVERSHLERDAAFKSSSFKAP